MFDGDLRLKIVIEDPALLSMFLGRGGCVLSVIKQYRSLQLDITCLLLAGFVVCPVKCATEVAT